MASWLWLAGMAAGSYLRLVESWTEGWSAPGILWSIATGVCVGVGTVVFFAMFQRGGPLSAVPTVLAVGAALMAVAGILIFHEPPSLPRVLGVMCSLTGLYLLGK